MKIMSFNTQHCRNYSTLKIDYPKMAEMIKSVDPDIVGLNEMRDELLGCEPLYDKQTSILASLTGFENSCFAKAIEIREQNKFSYGNGFLSKYKIVEYETYPIALPPEKRTYIHYESRVLFKAKLENGYTVLVTHFGLSPEEQEEAVRVVVPHLEDKKCILMGDFNLPPESEILLPIKERMVDCASVSAAKNLTFPSDKPEIKIDYIFVSPDVEILSFGAIERISSDHFPVTAEIK